MPPAESRLTRSDLRFGRKVVALVIAGFAAVMCAGGLAAYVMSRNVGQANWINHTFEVERHVNGIHLALVEMSSARRGILLGMAGSAPRYEEAHARLGREIATVAGLTRDNPAQQANIAVLRDQAAHLDHELRTSFDAGLEVDAAGQGVRESSVRRVEAVAARMLAAEQVLLSGRLAEQRRLIDLFYSVLLTAGVLVVCVGAASLFVILRYTRDLATTRNDLRRLNANLEGAVRERTRDLQRANEEIQRFAYIVSHDLRSPLVNIMGFTAELEAAMPPLARLVERLDAEAPALLDDEVRTAISVDLAESLGFIRASTAKMDRLINAILSLSRQGRRPLSPEPVALSPLAEGVVAALRHQADDRGATIAIAPDMPEIVSDRLALEQILSNLVENALKYLSPARAGDIRISARQTPRRVIVAVADNGRGIEPRDHARVFDLFRRSGVQNQPGEGIGLAHARALAYRLGGSLRVESALDQGSTFFLELPTHFAGEKDSMA